MGIVCAMQSEARPIVENMTVSERHTVNGRTFLCGELFCRPVVLAVSGIGKVNASSAALLLIEKFKADVILNVGVAGAADPSLQLSQIVVGESAIQYDFDLSESDGLPRGQLPGFDRFLPLDKRFWTRFKKAGFVTGRLATIDSFRYDEQNLLFLRELNVLAEDMEVAAIAQVCAYADVPLISVKAISNAIAEGGAKQYGGCLGQAVEALGGKLRQISELIYGED